MNFTWPGVIKEQTWRGVARAWRAVVCRGVPWRGLAGVWRGLADPVILITVQDQEWYIYWVTVAAVCSVSSLPSPFAA